MTDTATLREKIMKPVWITATLVLPVFCTVASSAGGSLPSFIVTNDDIAAPWASKVTFYPVNADGTLGAGAPVVTGGSGAGGGNFASNRVIVVPNSSGACVYASDAGTGDIAGIDAATQTVTGRFSGSSGDDGITDGIGLAASSKYLYASYSTSYTIATFQQQAGCKLHFLSDLNTFGLAGGWVGGMAARGNIMVVTYGDGSIESFDISGGAPVSHGDAQYSTGSSDDILPNGVAITRDRHFAIFGDTSAFANVEVSDLSSGKLAATVPYAVGKAFDSGNVRLSPDETMLFVSNNSTGQVTAAFFDKITGIVTPGCASAPLQGLFTHYSFTGNIGFQTASGTGGAIYVSEFGMGSKSYVGILNLTLDGATCTLTESPNSPVADPERPSALLSLAVYPAAQ